ncbi:F0F1 ATP synthase subunit delta [Roseomonas chloroacetimidivorans]|uniref:F0F1 ATP synthase subunit delta n=1 Tax=Roseomonas chloroacetimidivorans TaxID=1766656 RepID=UPI003C76ADB4
MRIDWWTLGLQTINVLVLIWLLRRFLFQPVKATIEARRAAAAKLLDDAEAARTQARSEAAALESRRRDFTAEGDAILAAAHAAAAAERTALLDQARQEAKRLETEKRAILEREREVQRRELESQAGELAVAMAQRLLALVPPERVTAAMLDALAQELTALSAEARRDLMAGSPVTVATAAALSADEQASWQKRLTEILGGDAQLVFRHDPSLIAGVELHGPHTLLRRNWRSDLERLARSLTLAPQARDVHQLA